MYGIITPMIIPVRCGNYANATWGDVAIMVGILLFLVLLLALLIKRLG
jgi:hypothetical protein